MILYTNFYFHCCQMSSNDVQDEIFYKNLIMCSELFAVDVTKLSYTYSDEQTDLTSFIGSYI